jgi:hypothetical protein
MGRGDLVGAGGRGEDGAALGVARPRTLALAVMVLLPAPAAPPHPPLAPYTGAGSWVSIYDKAAWRNPERVVQRLRAHGMHTLFLETSNFHHRAGVLRPTATARFVEAAHAAGLDVVGWYVPSLAAPLPDLRRALAAALFRTPSGQTFDSFALDLESTTVRSLPLRSRRAVSLTVALRRALPRRQSLGAITIDPVGGRYWDGYPFRRLARTVGVFLPMEYFTARTSGPKSVSAYSTANVLAIRKQAHDPRFPVHPIGGEARHASLAELRAFLRASKSSRAVGVSLWEYGETTPRQWAALAYRR